MKIQQLFDELKIHSHNAESVFENSGMVNDYAKLNYGFFPLGSGILSNKSLILDAEIEEGGIMVLGNDFGTISYIEEKCKDKRENNIANPTLRNILRLGLDLEKTFFTNFYLGLKNDIRTETVTMVSKKKITDEYIQLCYQFFLKQLELVKPNMVLCLGKDVKVTLEQEWIDKTLFDKYHFEFISHPSFAHINWKKSFLSEIKIKIEKRQRPIRGFGSAKGMFTLLPGWDDPLEEEFKDYM